MQTCLVVDDSSVIRKIASRILEEMNFRIIEAADGAQVRRAEGEQQAFPGSGARRPRTLPLGCRKR